VLVVTFRDLAFSVNQPRLRRREKMAEVPGRKPGRGGRVVDGSGLENQRGASLRGFESHPLRLNKVLRRP
jgi:hypothetical protein